MLVGYMRVSSDSDRQTTALQRDALLAAGVDERHLFEDKASGARDDRPGLARALDFMRPGDCLVVWKLDRLGRSLPHLLSIVTSLRDRNVAFRSLTEQMDTTTPHGEFLFGVFGALAQFERALTQERVRAGLAGARRRGRRGGRPPAIGADKLEAVIYRPRRGDQQGGGLPVLWRRPEHAHRYACPRRLDRPRLGIVIVKCRSVF
jgi:DNA invertase Pin-like site-specific DNA recombinase